MGTGTLLTGGTELKSPSQIRLQDVKVVDRVKCGQVEIAAAGAQIVVDASGVTGADRADDGVGEAVGKRAVKAFEISAAFKEVRVHKVHVERILFDVLPVNPRFPGVLFGGRAVNQTLRWAIYRALVAEADARLLGHAVTCARVSHARE